MTARPLVRISHRGGGSLAPENSVRGIETAIGWGVEMVEVDVRRSRDGALVLWHDPVLHGSPLPIADSSLEELRAASADGVTVLDEALEATRGRVRLNLDIKDPAVLEATIERVRAHGQADGVIVSCLETACLSRAAEIAADIPRFFSYPPDYGGASSKPWLKPAVDATVVLMRMTMHMRLRGMLRPLPGTGATLYYKMITPRVVSLARALGIDLYTWTVDDADQMRRLASLGVDGITSNRPDLLAELREPSASASSLIPR
jgi:glycerophosphoryl diester phosphodiesterase